MNDLVVIPTPERLPAPVPATVAAVPARVRRNDEIDRAIAHYRRLVATGVRVEVPRSTPVTALTLFTSGKAIHLAHVPSFIRAEADKIGVSPKVLAAVVIAALKRRSAADAASLALSDERKAAYDPVSYAYDEEDGVVKAYDTRTMERIDGNPSWSAGFGLKA
ncbi:hypothetical protein [Paraburkholderia sp. BL21I4N1]|uniref:hypothetical protein n=1 Tax=Paraburkholderia sp. BL21I4N1 TaxID=1938801 RepID=UPI000CFD1E03|nr:hypothetical protein [Paraburkholderia sp. BL21I4N1]PQV53321.1 hypothetical protein B0G83_102407 [Paraburkholderia sp. BL21I4N1]